MRAHGQVRGVLLRLPGPHAYRAAPPRDVWTVRARDMTERPKPTPLVRTDAQKQAAQAASDAAAAKAAEDARQLAVSQASMRTAQIANLLIGGHTFESIGASIGSTAKEVEDMLNSDSTRYIRSQPALRQWVRRWASGKYSEMLEAVYPQATDPTNKEQLAYQDRARPLIEKIVKLHGAEAPVQSEVKVEAAPESVQKLVDAIAAAQGLGYDIDIFDEADENTVDAVLVEDLHALEQAAADEAGLPQPEDEENPL